MHLLFCFVYQALLPPPDTLDSPAVLSAAALVDKASNKWAFNFYFMPVYPLCYFSVEEIEYTWIKVLHDNVYLHAMTYPSGCDVLLSAVMFSFASLWLWYCLRCWCDVWCNMLMHHASAISADSKLLLTICRRRQQKPQRDGSTKKKK
jgi:hypothetical protein